jgi:hypothetical protein
LRLSCCANGATQMETDKPIADMTAEEFLTLIEELARRAKS